MKQVRGLQFLNGYITVPKMSQASGVSHFSHWFYQEKLGKWEKET